VYEAEGEAEGYGVEGRAQGGRMGEAEGCRAVCGAKENKAEGGAEEYEVEGGAEWYGGESEAER